VSGLAQQRRHAIVTRPEPDASGWVQLLAERGVVAGALPLIGILPASDPEPIRVAWRNWGSFKAVMFVSSPAAGHFFAQQPWRQRPLAHGAQPRIWCTGPGSAAVLRRLGAAPELLDAPAPDSPQFDSEALWDLVAGQIQQHDQVLIVRGEADSDGDDAADVSGRGTGREWLAARLARVGARVGFVVAYRRVAPVWSQAQRQLAQQAATDGSVWIFTSAQGALNLGAAAAHASWSAALAVATHPRVGATVRGLGFGTVVESRPTLDALVASIESMQ